MVTQRIKPVVCNHIDCPDFKPSLCQWFLMDLKLVIALQIIFTNWFFSVETFINEQNISFIVYYRKNRFLNLFGARLGVSFTKYQCTLLSTQCSIKYSQTSNNLEWYLICTLSCTTLFRVLSCASFTLHPRGQINNLHCLICVWEGS